MSAKAATPGNSRISLVARMVGMTGTPRGARSTVKCELIQTAVEKSTWSKTHSKNHDNAKQVIMSYRDHIKGTCKCVPDVACYYLGGVAYFEYFMAKLERFGDEVSKAEAIVCKNDEDEAAKQNPSGVSDSDPRDNPLSAATPDQLKPSKFDSTTIHDLVNTSSHTVLIEPLKNAVKYWIMACDSDCPNLDIRRFKVTEYVTAAYHIFQCYMVLDYQERCARLLLKISTDLSDLVNAHCFLTQVYLSRGDIKNAKETCDLGAQFEEQLREKRPDAYEIYSYLLVKCEVDLSCGNAKKSAESLKWFLKSDYLKKMTLNRYILKGQALNLACKFQVDDYEFSKDHEEFIEPIQYAFCILKRWHRTFLDSKESDKSKETASDSVSYKFVVYAYCMNTYINHSTFITSCGNPSELMFYHNPLLKLCRKYCFLFW